MRGLLTALASLALALAVFGFWLFATRAGNSLSEAQRAVLSGQLDALLAGWDSAHAPPAARRLVFFVSGEPDGDLLDPPSPRTPLAPVLSLLRRGSLRAEHQRRVAALAGAQYPVCDWYEQGRVWGAEKRRRLDALTLALTKARGGRARVIMVVDGRGAALASEALSRVPVLVSTGPDIAVDRLISVGGEGFPDSPRVGEILAFWRSEGDAVTPAGTQAQLRDAQGRLLRQVLQGQAATADGVAALARGLVETEQPAGEFLRAQGQTLAPPVTLSASSGPEPAKPGAIPPKPASKPADVGAAGLPGGPAVAKPKPAPGSVPSGWVAEHVDGPDGDIGWTVAGPNQTLARRFSGHGCAQPKDFAGASSDKVPAGCDMLVCLTYYTNKPLQQLVIQRDADPNVSRPVYDGGSEGALRTKVLSGTQFGFASFLFIKSRTAEDRWPAKDMYHYAVEGKDVVLDLRYEVWGKDPAACGRPFFDIYDKAAHSIAQERIVQ